LKYETLIPDIERVLDTLNTKEQEVETEDDRWYNMRILPYRTVENVIEGVVITFAEITIQKQTEAELRRLNEALQTAQTYGQNIIDTLHEGILILDTALRVVSANRSFYRRFQLTPGEIEGKHVYELKNMGWDIASLRQRLEEIVPHDQTVERYEFEHHFPGLGRRKLRLNARRLTSDTNKEEILLAIEDITGYDK
jgi:two-component system CheB/CheR fusion protein